MISHIYKEISATQFEIFSQHFILAAQGKNDVNETEEKQSFFIHFLAICTLHCFIF